MIVLLITEQKVNNYVHQLYPNPLKLAKLFNLIILVHKKQVPTVLQYITKWSPVDQKTT